MTFRIGGNFRPTRDDVGDRRTPAPGEGSKQRPSKGTGGSTWLCGLVTLRQRHPAPSDQTGGTARPTAPKPPSMPMTPATVRPSGTVQPGGLGPRRTEPGRQPALQAHETQQAAYQLGLRLNGTPIESASERQRLADATATVHETRLALARGRGNVDSDLRQTKGQSAAYTALSYSLGETNDDALAGSALAARAGNCDHNGAINTRRHAGRMEEGGQIMTVYDSDATHVYALYQPPAKPEAAAGAAVPDRPGAPPLPVVLDSWADGPAVLLRDSHWAEGHGKHTEVLERFDKPSATDALARAHAVKAQIEDPHTPLHAEAKKLEAAFVRNPSPGAIYAAMPVIDPALADGVRQKLAEHSPLSREVLAAGAGRQAYGLSVAQATAPQTTAAILDDAKHLDQLSRPALKVGDDAAG